MDRDAMERLVECVIRLPRRDGGNVMQGLVCKVQACDVVKKKEGRPFGSQPSPRCLLCGGKDIHARSRFKIFIFPYSRDVLRRIKAHSFGYSASRVTVSLWKGSFVL
jgi:hypothetical protein